MNYAKKCDRMVNGKLCGLSAELRNCFPDAAIEENFSLARHTTIGCGGCAAVCIEPANERDAEAVLRYLHRNAIPYYILGAGANVLPSDERFEGVAVRFRALRKIVRVGDCIEAGAGVTGGSLLRFARGEELGGLEPFTGIPMTVGGGITMNAGIAVRHFSDVVEEVLAVREGELIVLRAKDCGFSEKYSVFQNKIAVLGARLRLTPSAVQSIERESCYFRTRRAHLPKGRSMGCTFVNPEGISAGALIEACGLKGMREGKAFVSERHANFIINEGQCAADVARLIQKIKQTVYKEKGVSLREEIRRIPPQPIT